MFLYHIVSTLWLRVCVSVCFPFAFNSPTTSPAAQKSNNLICERDFMHFKRMPRWYTARQLDMHANASVARVRSRHKSGCHEINSHCRPISMCDNKISTSTIAQQKRWWIISDFRWRRRRRLNSNSEYLRICFVRLAFIWDLTLLWRMLFSPSAKVFNLYLSVSQF